MTDQTEATPSQELKFSKKALADLPTTGKQYSVRDPKTPGLVLLVTPKGAKAFYSYRWINGKPERFKLGTFGTMTLDEARRAASKINGSIASGQNPNQAKRNLKGELTFREALEDYVKKKRNRNGKPLADYTKVTYLTLIDKHLSSIAGLRLSQVTPEVLRRIKIESDATVNRAKAVVSAVFTWAEGEGLTEAANPAKAIKSRVIKSRERFLLPSELPGFFDALNKNPLRDFFYLALLTGVRKGNLQEMRWGDVDLEEAVWRIPKTKNGDAMTIPLTPEAVGILKERKQQKVVNVVWVFPGSGETGHLVEPKRAWANLVETAGLKGLRIHDLRRTLGSWQARQGSSLTIIGKSLGHKSQTATAIYSRLDLDPVRESVESATAAIVEAGRGSKR